MNSKEIKFILRENLHKLASYLRFLGYDALCPKKISFHNIERIANEDDRIILTRSIKESKIKTSNKIIRIQSETVLEQLKELNHLINFDESKIANRCMRCNRKLSKIDKNTIKDFMPEYIFIMHDEFKVCKKCGKIYWKGSHFNDLKQSIETVFK